MSWEDLGKGVARIKSASSPQFSMDMYAVDSFGEVDICIEDEYSENCIGVGHEDRVKMIKWLIGQTPGWDA